MNVTALSVLTPVLVVVALSWAYIQYNPLFGSRLRVVTRSRTRDGHTIYIFRWRPEHKPEKGSEGNPVHEMRKHGLLFLDEDGMRQLMLDKGLPGGISISTELNEGSVITLHVYTGGAKDLMKADELPYTTFDFYAGIKECHVRSKTENRELTPVNGT
jgi:hypothetical protein